MSPYLDPPFSQLAPHTPAGSHAEQRSSAYPQKGQAAGQRRQVSLCDEIDRLTLTEPPAPQCEAAATTPTTVAPQLPLFDRTALKTALHNLVNNALSSADFIMLAHRFGYHYPLHNFPLDTLQPSDWLALRERVRRQIVQHDGTVLLKLPPAAITCHICIAAYYTYGKELFKLIPARLQEPFYNLLIELRPFAVLEIPPSQRTFKRLLAACCADPSLLCELADGDRSTALLTELCRRTGCGLTYLPDAKRSYGLCLKACQQWGQHLEHVPDRHKDSRLCWAALSNQPLAFQWLPKKLAQKAHWQLAACQREGCVLEWIPQALHNNTLLEAACRNNAMALMYIKEEQITYRMCLLACAQSAFGASQHIPDRHLDEDMRWRLCLAINDRQLCEQFMPKTANCYERLLRENSSATLEWVPEESRTADHYLLACQKRGADLELVPEQHRTPEICLAACRQRGLALEWVPERHLSAAVCQAACDQNAVALRDVPIGTVGVEWFVKAVHQQKSGWIYILRQAKQLLSDAECRQVLAEMFGASCDQRLRMLSLEEISSTQKDQLIEWMLEPERWQPLEQRKESDLCEMASPLLFFLQSQEMNHLKIAAIKAAAHWTPPRHSAGQRLQGEIERALSCAVVGVADPSEVLFQRPGTVVGGRTLKIGQGAQASYYKFQRQGESLQTLMREGIISLSA